MVVAAIPRTRICVSTSGWVPPNEWKSLEIRWTSGKTSTLGDLPVNRTITIQEGEPEPLVTTTEQDSKKR